MNTWGTMRKVLLFFFLVTAGHVSCAQEGATPPEDYQRALRLIHAFGGSGNELTVAMELAERLATSHPNGGYAETLRAEALSTWQLNQQGQPAELRARIIALTDRALRLNPKLAQAHVARARALLRASEYEQANQAIDTALKLDSNLNGAMFLRADIFRRRGSLADAETWYLKFIAATADKPRQSNGYYWLGKAYQEAAGREQPSRRGPLMAKARTAYEKMLELHPDGAWQTVNLAIFLNDDAADFDAAERYAARALRMMEFPMARYHLAIARYQKLLSAMSGMDAKGYRQTVAQVQQSTGISLEDALEFARTYPQIHERLQLLQRRTRQN